MNIRFRPTRRQFFLAAGATAAATGVYSWRVEPHWVQVVRRTLPVRRLPPALEGKTLAQLSDIHVGPQVDPDYLKESLEHVSSALRPDLIALTGDFMTAAGPSRVDEVAEVLEHLTIPPLGCFAVLGNHDYGEGWRSPELADRLADRLTGLGIRVLRNASCDVAGLRIVGVDDLWGTNFRPEEALVGVTPETPALALCHNPDAADRPVWDRFRGWILSGHTHGGQCKPPVLPPPLLPVSNRRYTAGAFAIHGGRTVYINRGLGHIIRVRFNARPEITLFQLVSA